MSNVLTREKIEQALNTIDSDWRWVGSECHWCIGAKSNLDKNWNSGVYRTALQKIGANMTPNRLIVYKGRYFYVETDTACAQIHY